MFLVYPKYQVTINKCYKKLDDLIQDAVNCLK